MSLSKMLLACLKAAGEGCPEAGSGHGGLARCSWQMCARTGFGVDYPSVSTGPLPKAGQQAAGKMHKKADGKEHLSSHESCSGPADVG